MFQSLEKNEGTLNQLKERNAELEKDVERVRQRDELLAKVRAIKLCLNVLYTPSNVDSSAVMSILFLI